jgi:hypothetical protein
VKRSGDDHLIKYYQVLSGPNECLRSISVLLAISSNAVVALGREKIQLDVKLHFDPLWTGTSEPS